MSKSLKKNSRSTSRESQFKDEEKAIKMLEQELSDNTHVLTLINSQMLKIYKERKSELKSIFKEIKNGLNALQSTLESLIDQTYQIYSNINKELKSEFQQCLEKMVLIEKENRLNGNNSLKKHLINKSLMEIKENISMKKEVINSLKDFDHDFDGRIYRKKIQENLEKVLLEFVDDTISDTPNSSYKMQDSDILRMSSILAKNNKFKEAENLKKVFNEIKT